MEIGSFNIISIILINLIMIIGIVFNYKTKSKYLESAYLMDDEFNVNIKLIDGKLNSLDKELNYNQIRCPNCGATKSKFQKCEYCQ